MRPHPFLKVPCLLAAIAVSASGFSQAASRGSIAVFPVVFDKSGSNTSREKAAASIAEVLRKGGFKVVSTESAAKVWSDKGYSVPTLKRPASVQQLSGFGKAIGSQYVCTASITFHTRSIWVNLGPKTISNCSITLTIVDARLGKIVYEADGEGRSDEKSDGLKAAGALLITPIITAVSGGPKTPQESRAAQIAAARALEKFVIVE